MAGTYWLTVLPETSQLDKGIKDAVSKVDAEVTVTPKVDPKAAEDAGKKAGDAVTKGHTKAVEKSQSDLSKAWSKALNEAASVAGDVAIEALGDALGSDKSFSDIGKSAAENLGSALAENLGDELLDVAVLAAPKMIDGLTNAVKKGSQTAQSVKNLGKSVADSLGESLGSAANLDDKLAGAFRGMGDLIRRSVSSAAKLSASDLSDTIQNAAKQTGSAAGHLLGDALRGTGVGGAIADIVGDLTGLQEPINAVQDSAGKIVDSLKSIKSGDAAGAVSGLSNALRDIAGDNDASTTLQNIADKAQPLQDTFGSLKGGIRETVDDLKDLAIGSPAVVTALEAISDAAGPLALLATAVTTIWNGLPGIGGGLSQILSATDPSRGFVRPPGQEVTQTPAAQMPLPGAVQPFAPPPNAPPGVKYQAKQGSLDPFAPPDLPDGHALGGLITGAGSGTSDSIPALLSNGEWVTDASNTAKWMPVLKLISAGATTSQVAAALWTSLPRFKDGGAAGNVNATGMQVDTVAVAQAVEQLFPGVSIGGYRNPDGYNEHSSGEAADIMVGGNKALGDSIKAWALAQAQQYDIEYVLWQQRQWNPDGTSSPMPDRGSPTQNHMDHVHVRTAGGGYPAGGGPGPGGGGTPASGRTSTTPSAAAAALSQGISLTSGIYAPAGFGGAGGYGGSGSYGGGYGGASSFNQGLVGGGGTGYRAPTGAELNAAQQNLDTANAAQQAAQQNLDAVRAGTHTQEQLNDAQQKLATATAQTNRAKGAFDQLNGGAGVPTIGGNGDGQGGGDDLGQLGQILTQGALESSGFDGSVFSNPLDWPLVKSGLAAINAFSAFLPGAKNGKAGGLAGGIGQSLGLGGLFDHVAGATSNPAAGWIPKSGSPQLSPGQFNPAAQAGGSGPDIAGAALSAFSPGPSGAQQGGGDVHNDNSISIVNPVGNVPPEWRDQLHAESTGRTRTTAVKG